MYFESDNMQDQEECGGMIRQKKRKLVSDDEM